MRNIYVLHMLERNSLYLNSDLGFICFLHFLHPWLLSHQSPKSISTGKHPLSLWENEGIETPCTIDITVRSDLSLTQCITSNHDIQFSYLNTGLLIKRFKLTLKILRKWENIHKSFWHIFKALIFRCQMVETGFKILCLMLVNGREVKVKYCKEQNKEHYNIPLLLNWFICVLSMFFTIFIKTAAIYLYLNSRFWCFSQCFTTKYKHYMV